MGGERSKIVFVLLGLTPGERQAFQEACLPLACDGAPADGEAAASVDEALALYQKHSGKVALIIGSAFAGSLGGEGAACLRNAALRLRAADADAPPPSEDVEWADPQRLQAETLRRLARLAAMAPPSLDYAPQAGGASTVGEDLAVYQTQAVHEPPEEYGRSDDDAPPDLTALGKTAFDQCPHFLALVDTKGRILHLNGVCQQYFADPNEDLRGIPFSELIVPNAEGTADHRRLHQGILRTAGGTPQHLRLEFTRPGRPAIPVDVQLTPLRRGIAGPVQAVMLDARDMSEIRRGQRALERSNKLLQGVLDNMQEGVYVLRPLCDEEGEITDFLITVTNAEAARIVGRPMANLIGAQLLDMAPPETVGPLIKRYARLLETHDGEAFDYYYADELVSGWYEVHASAFEDYVLVTFRDISEVKREELALRGSSEIRPLLLSQPELMIRYDRDGCILFANNALAEFFGRTQEDLRGASFFDLLPPAASAALRQKLDALEPGKRDQSLELSIPSHSNGPRWVLWSISPLPEQAGSLPRFQSIGLDITERRQEWERLRLAHDRLSFILASSRTVLFTCDPEAPYRMHYISEGVEELLGWPMDKVLGEEDFFQASGQQRGYARWKEAVAEARTHGHSSVELRLRHEEGAYLWVAVELSFALPDGEAGGQLVGTFTNITSRKKAEQALAESQRLEATALLAGGVAHTLNNLMLGVLGNAELLRDDAADNHHVLEGLHRISDAAQRASDLTRQLLAFARQGNFWPRHVSLNQLILETLTFQNLGLRPQHRLNRQLSPNLPLVFADPSQLSQVIIALVHNAAEAIGDQGSIAITTESRRIAGEENRVGELADGTYVVLRVEDDGAGMEPEVRNRMFEPFFSTKFKGRGLGLAAVYGIVQNLGGCICVETEPGNGTRIDVFIPASNGGTEAPPSEGFTEMLG